MTRYAFVPLILLAFAPLSPAKRIAAPPSPVQRALQSEVVITGKVTAIEKEPIELADAPGGPKIAHKVAVIKVDSALVGAENMTHIKVGFTAARGRGPAATLEEKQEGIFFLTKHSSGQFYTFNWMTSPVNADAENYKATVAGVKKALAAIADPEKSLKSKNAEDRTFAAIALILKYRSIPQNGRQFENEKIPADESKLILKALAEASWTKFDPAMPPPTNAFYMLAINSNDGWTAPKPGQPGTNYNEVIQKAFAQWIEGAGKDYRINKFVTKK